MRTLVTGGAGFIGSHLVDHLIELGCHTTVFDNLFSGSLDNLSQSLHTEEFKFIKGDLCDPSSIERALEDCDAVYHLAANPEVRISKASPRDHFNQNIFFTFNLLEAIRKNGGIKFLGFTSTSTVYGEPSIIPTPETYGPMKPISNYGASKIAGEAMISSYASLYGFSATIFRLANIIGPRSNHGVIYDFIKKLKLNQKELEVLGDGQQLKSYLYIDDCISGLLFNFNKYDRNVEIFNVGSEDQCDVINIAEIVIQEMGLSDVLIKTTGGVDGGRGWIGDVKSMMLDTTQLRNNGWKPKFNSSEAVRLTAKYLSTML